MTLRARDRMTRRLIRHLRDEADLLRTRERRGMGIATRSFGALALGAVAIGALAMGALAIGALAIGRLAVGRARIRRLEIDELVVRSLDVTEELRAPAMPDSER